MVAELFCIHTFVKFNKLDAATCMAPPLVAELSEMTVSVTANAELELLKANSTTGIMIDVTSGDGCIIVIAGHIHSPGAGIGAVILYCHVIKR